MTYNAIFLSLLILCVQLHLYVAVLIKVYNSVFFFYKLNAAVYYQRQFRAITLFSWQHCASLFSISNGFRLCRVLCSVRGIYETFIKVHTIIMSLFNELLPKLFEISKSSEKNICDELQVKIIMIFQMVALFTY